jgi:hypothetical protein
VVTKRLVELMEAHRRGKHGRRGQRVLDRTEPDHGAATCCSRKPNWCSTQAPVAAGAPLRTLLYVEDNPANLELVEQLIARRSDLRLLTAPTATWASNSRGPTCPT